MKKHKTQPGKKADVRNCQLVLARELAKLTKRLHKEFAGVWRAEAVDDLAVVAEELPLMAQKGIDARIMLWWQPALKLRYEPLNENVEEVGWTDEEGVVHEWQTDELQLSHDINMAEWLAGKLQEEDGEPPKGEGRFAGADD